MASRVKQSGLNAAMHTSGIFSDMSLDGPEIGTLVVVVDRAKNLPSRRSMGKQDPYCAARLGKEAKKTNTDRRGGQTPRWDQELRFTVRDSPDYLTLKISVFNDDKKTELIGENFLRLDDVLTPGGGEAEMWHTLTCRGKYAGEVRLELTYYDSRPKAEKPVSDRRRERATTESPTVAGGRQMPVKRRPLPSDPNSVQSTPEPDAERPRPLPQVGSGAHQTPPRPSQASAEYTTGSVRRSTYNQQQPMPIEHRDYSNQSYSDYDMSQEDPFAVHPPQPNYEPSVHPSQSEYEPSIHPQDSYDSIYGHPQHGAAPRRNSNVSHAPYPMHDGPPVVSLHQQPHSRRNTVMAPALLTHSNSEPIVPYFDHHEPRHSLHHTSSESRVHDRLHSHSGLYRPLPTSTEHDDLYDEPDIYAHQDEHYSPNHRHEAHPDYSTMQPSVEDDEPPPPPPTHRNSAPHSAPHQRKNVSSYSIGMAPAPLNITPPRRPAPADIHMTTSPLRMQSSPHHAGSLHNIESPQNQAYDQNSSSYSTPERRGSANAMSQSPYTQDPLDMSAAAYNTSSDAQRRLPNSAHRMSVPQHLASSPASSARASPYQTPPRGTHPLATHQSAMYGSSPTEPLQYSPADAEPTPLIKPRPISPATEQRHDSAPQTMRPAVKVNMIRKSVPGRPTSHGTESSVPFGPDSFDAYNPNLRRSTGSGAASTYSTPPRSQHGSLGGGELQLDQSVRQSPYNEVDSHDGTPIHDLHGNVIDPSDRLPVDSWAPEPERKGFSFQAKITPRERDRLNGARSMGNSPSSSWANGENPDELGGSFSMSTRSDVSSQVSAGSSLLATVGNSRNKLQKKNRPQSEYITQSGSLHGPGQAQGAGNYPYVNNVKRASYDTHTGTGTGAGAPPIPAKVPLDTVSVAEELDRLNFELASIDIGPSSGAMVRKPRRFGF